MEEHWLERKRRLLERLDKKTGHKPRRIIIDQPMEALPENEQDAIFRLARENNVFCRDVNGSLWQVLDLTTDESELV